MKEGVISEKPVRQNMEEKIQLLNCIFRDKGDDLRTGIPVTLYRKEFTATWHDGTTKLCLTWRYHRENGGGWRSVFNTSTVEHYFKSKFFDESRHYFKIEKWGNEEDSAVYCKKKIPLDLLKKMFCQGFARQIKILLSQDYNEDKTTELKCSLERLQANYAGYGYLLAEELIEYLLNCLDYYQGFYKLLEKKSNESASALKSVQKVINALSNLNKNLGQVHELILMNFSRYFSQIDSHENALCLLLPLRQKYAEAAIDIANLLLVMKLPQQEYRYHFILILLKPWFQEKNNNQQIDSFIRIAIKGLLKKDKNGALDPFHIADSLNISQSIPSIDDLFWSLEMIVQIGKDLIKICKENKIENNETDQLETLLLGTPGYSVQYFYALLSLIKTLMSCPDMTQLTENNALLKKVSSQSLILPYEALYCQNKKQIIKLAQEKLQLVEIPTTESHSQQENMSSMDAIEQWLLFVDSTTQSGDDIHLCDPVIRSENPKEEEYTLHTKRDFTKINHIITSMINLMQLYLQRNMIRTKELAKEFAFFLNLPGVNFSGIEFSKASRNICTFLDLKSKDCNYTPYLLSEVDQLNNHFLALKEYGLFDEARYADYFRKIRPSLEDGTFLHKLKMGFWDEAEKTSTTETENSNLNTRTNTNPNQKFVYGLAWDSLHSSSNTYKTHTNLVKLTLIGFLSESDDSDDTAVSSIEFKNHKMIISFKDAEVAGSFFSDIKANYKSCSLDGSEISLSNLDDIPNFIKCFKGDPDQVFFEWPEFYKYYQEKSKPCLIM